MQTNPYMPLETSEASLIAKRNKWLLSAERWTFSLAVLNLIGLNLGGLVLLAGSKKLRFSRKWFWITTVCHALNVLLGLFVVGHSLIAENSGVIRFWNIDLIESWIGGCLLGISIGIIYAVPLYYLAQIFRTQDFVKTTNVSMEGTSNSAEASN